jgi:choice-of-anchor B domain-containing protein
MVGFIGAAGAPGLACPGFVPCVPSACLSMHTRAQSVASAGPDVGGPLPYPSRNMTLVGHLPLAQMGGVSGATGSSLYGWTDPLTRREYAIMGRSNGTAFIDVTVPSSPVYVANLPMQPGSSQTLWREPKVYGNHAYVGVDGTSHPLQVVNLAQLRNYSGTTMTLGATTFSGSGTVSINRAHTLAINADTGFLYAAGTNRHAGGLYAIDVRNPAAPAYAGGYALDGYTHETQVVTYRGPDAQYRGREIAFNSNGVWENNDSLGIVDVTNKSAMTRISRRSYPNAGYIHQGWLTEDQRYFFQNDEFDESNGVTGGRTRTHLWDVSDLDNPVYRGFYDHQTTSVDHNLYVRGNYLYETNYTTGLRVLRIGNLESTNPSDWLTEVAFFDTYPQNDAQTYNGAWNNFPYFDSGNILVSDIDGGLFVLRMNLPENPQYGVKPPPLHGPVFAPVPEPGSATVFAGALCVLALGRRRGGARGARRTST